MPVPADPTPGGSSAAPSSDARAAAGSPLPAGSSPAASEAGASSAPAPDDAGTSGEGTGEAACLNCGAPVPGRFCGRCGQERRTLRVAFHRLAGEALAESFSLDSRVARSLGALLFRPGALTRSYLDGKRASQTSPIKLYLLLSFIYFFAGALAPTQMELTAGGQVVSRGEGTSVEIEEKDLAELRAAGGLRARMAERLEHLSRLPPGEARQRIGASLTENAPKAMFFLVPVLALLTRLFFLRSGLYYAEHVVLALHEHAAVFLFLLPTQITSFWTRSSTLLELGALASAVHFAVALRRVFGRSWGATLARAAAVGFLYLVLLGLSLSVVVLLAIASL